MNKQNDMCDEMAKDVSCCCRELENDGCHRKMCIECLSMELIDLGYTKNEWISVEDRLPEEYKEYIVMTNANGKNNGVMSQRWVKTTFRGKEIKRWEWQGKISPWQVSHWMEFPQPPKKDNKCVN